MTSRSQSQYSKWYFYSLVCFPLEEVTLLRLVLGTGEELAPVVLCELGDQYFYSLVCFPLEEVTLLGLVLGTGEELASVVLCELGDLSEDGGTAVAASRVIQVGPAKMLARLRPEQSNAFFLNLLLTKKKFNNKTIIYIFSITRKTFFNSCLFLFSRVVDRCGNV